MRLIDADELLRRMKADPLFPVVDRYNVAGPVECSPTVDAVPVVRCADCIHFPGEEGDPYCPCTTTGDPYYDWTPAPDWYCADGERLESKNETAQPVIRCRDCKHGEKYGDRRANYGIVFCRCFSQSMPENGFCSYGKERGTE